MPLSNSPSTPTLAYLTAELPGVGGVIKSRPDDFAVEEIPLYQPCGEGTHTYLRIEKRGLTTQEAARRIAQALGKEPRNVGFAGLKDAHAVTRQMLSIEHVDPDAVASLAIDGVTVLAVDRHTNKLKRGHLAGNRFDIKVRDTLSGALPRARAVLDLLTRRGVPNYFGPQRFGNRGDNGRVGLAAMKCDWPEAVRLLLGGPLPNDRQAEQTARTHFDAGRLREALGAWPGYCRPQIRMCKELIRSRDNVRRAWRAMDFQSRQFLVSAGQSELFNRLLEERIDRIDELETGDLAWKHANGAVFRVENTETEQPRCLAQEISATGPLFGRRMTQPTDEPLRRESAVLAAAGLDLDKMSARDVPFQGGRRPLRVPLRDADLSEGRDDHGPFLRLAFALPAGAYATTVLREICKTEPVGADDDD